MVAVLLYNVWHYANFLFCRALKKQFCRLLLPLTCLAVHFEGFVIGGFGPPRHYAFLDAFVEPIWVDLALNSAYFSGIVGLKM